jgi:hypothetical protein
VESYKSYYETVLVPEARNLYMINDGNLKELLISPCSRKNQNGYSTCSSCFSGMQPKMIRNKFPPKFAIANGFVIGSMPQVLQWTTANGEKKSRFIAEHELTNLLKAMMAPVRPYGLIFSCTGGAQKSFKGFMPIKKRDDNLIGNLVLKDLKETVEGLYRHLMKGDTKNEDLVAEKITQDINEHFSGGYNIIWNDTPNHFLVDFDIICILKNHIGYNSLSDVPMDQRERCYRGYNQKNILPD